MMAMVLFCILGRIIKLAICLIDDSNSQRKFVYNMFTENLPILFKMIFVTQYCKYKLNTYYIATYKRASAWVRWGLVMLELYIFLDYLVITVSAFSPGIHHKHRHAQPYRRGSYNRSPSVFQTFKHGLNREIVVI